MKRDRTYFCDYLALCAVGRLMKKEPINSSKKYEIHKNFLKKVWNSHKFFQKVWNSHKFPPSYQPILLAFTCSDIYPPTPIVQDRVKYLNCRSNVRCSAKYWQNYFTTKCSANCLYKYSAYIALCNTAASVIQRWAEREGGLSWELHYKELTESPVFWCIVQCNKLQIVSI